MFFNKYYYILLIFTFFNIASGIRISYHDLKENQIVDLIYFPCHGYCIKLDHDSHVYMRLNPTLSITNQFLIKKNQADNCEEFLSKYLSSDLNSDNCEAIKVKLTKNKISIVKEGHDDVTTHNIDESSSSLRLFNNANSSNSSTYSFKVNKKISTHTCKAFTSMCNAMLSTECSKDTTKINECSQLSSNQFTSKCYCYDSDNNNNNYNNQIISNMLRTSNIKVVSEHCRFNCYDYQKVCNEVCNNNNNINYLKKFENNGKPIINFCNYKYQDNIFEIGCICDNGIQKTNRILDNFKYRCEFS